MRPRLIAAERAIFPVRLLCRLAAAAVSDSYAWLIAACAATAQAAILSSIL